MIVKIIVFFILILDKVFTNQEQIPENCKLFVQVNSAGWHDGNFFEILINNEKVYRKERDFSPEGDSVRGVYIGQLDTENDVLVDTTSFDTYGSSEDVNSMVQYIKELKPHYLLLVGTLDSAQAKMTSQAYQALYSLGMEQGTIFSHRGNYALIGGKNLEVVGSFIEQNKPSYSGFSSVSQCITLKQCSKQCNLCSKEPNTCLLCQERENQNPVPDCNCKQGYYQTSDNQCQLLDDGLAYYYDENEKTQKLCPEYFSSCDSQISGICKGKNRQQNNSCKCILGHTSLNNIDDCQQCEQPCKECQNLTENCTLCQLQFYLQSNDETQTCLKCDDKYQECNGEKEGICKGQHRISNTCECLSNYYEKERYSDCIKCQQKYITCDGENIGICKGQNRQTNTCLCLNTFYQDDKYEDCQKCQEPCYLCQSSDICITCIQGFFLDIEAKTCIKCKDKFSECISLNEGSGCKGLFRDTNDNKNCNCIDNYFDNEEDLDCQICQSPCQKCISEVLCVSCIEGYYLQGQNCVECSYKFENCIEENIGDKCKGQNRQTPNCECKTNYYEKFTNNQDCEICIESCMVCASESICVKCNDQNYLENNECKPCQKNSQNPECAINNEIIQQKTCDGNFRINDDQECDCMDGYYDDGVNYNCQICESPCLSCQNSKSNCFTCIKGYYLDNNKCSICTDQDYKNQTECQQLVQDKINTQNIKKDKKTNKSDQNSDNLKISALVGLNLLLLLLIIIILYYLYRKYKAQQNNNQVEQNQSVINLDINQQKQEANLQVTTSDLDLQYQINHEENVKNNITSNNNITAQDNMLSLQTDTDLENNNKEKQISNNQQSNGNFTLQTRKRKNNKRKTKY